MDTTKWILYNVNGFNTALNMPEYIKLTIQ